jgi:Family of unknown function (DUF5706)
MGSEGGQHTICLLELPWQMDGTRVMAQEQQSSALPAETAPAELANAPTLGVPERDIPEISARPAPNLTQSHTDFAEFQEGYVGRYITLADTKASWAFAIASGVLAYLLSKSALRAQLLDPSWTPHFVLLIPPLALLIASATSLLVITPRLSNSGEGLVFFGAVSKWPDASRYVEEVGRRSEAQLTELRLKHCFDVSKLCARKYGLLRKAILLGVAGLVAALSPVMIFGG